MTMRHRYLVAYDVSDPKRLKRMYKKMCGFGDPLQYSVFQCALSDVELVLMKDAIGEIINHAEDRVMIADIGPLDGRARAAFQYMGVQWRVPEEEGAVIV
jgi:CRISPR-associated protein Cas2